MEFAHSTDQIRRRRHAAGRPPSRRRRRGAARSRAPSAPEARWPGAALSPPNAVLTPRPCRLRSGVAQVSDMSGTVRLHRSCRRARRAASGSRRTSTPPDCRRCRSTCASASPERACTIDAATLGFAGGTLGLADVTLAAGKPADATLTIRAVDLGALLGLLDIDGLSGTGTIEGAVPIRVDPSGAALRSGQLVGTVPGVMRYAGTGLPEPDPNAPATDPIRLMRAALADFHYTGLKLDARARRKRRGEPADQPAGRQPPGARQPPVRLQHPARRQFRQDRGDPVPRLCGGGRPDPAQPAAIALDRAAAAVV